MRRNRRERDERDERAATLALHGDTVAWGLCEGFGGDPEAGTGWRGALQAAADESEQDQEILRIADEIYAFAHLIRSDLAVMTYADASLTVLDGAPATWFLHGMLQHVRQRGDD